MSHDFKSPHQRVLTLPTVYEARIAAALDRLGYRLDDARGLASAVTRLSDHYIAKPDAATPWHEPWAQAASLAYFFPLNYARNAAVAAEARRLGFFRGLTSLVDLGSGTGSALFALLDLWPENARPRARACDVSSTALDLARSLAPPGAWPDYERVVADAGQTAKPRELSGGPGVLAVASYVLTELAQRPAWWSEFGALAIIEPSTQDDGRKLMRTRAELIEAGFRIWAPCTHHDGCPLLERSDRDWCHDRIHWQAPAWLGAVEKHLPMKNRTLTFSYLLARRERAPLEGQTGFARLTGDTLIEKGKSRQSACRGPEREFLAWFPQRLKKGEELGFERGNLLRLKPDLALKSNEIRIDARASAQELAPDTPIGGDQ